MDRAALADRIDHTVLGPTTTPDDVRRVLDEALEHGMRACVPPCYVDDAHDYAPSVPLVTVVGFPHGHHETAVKREEAVRAWDRGADEVDVVANLGRLVAGEADAVEHDLAEVVAAVPVPVKVIVEASLLDEAALRTVAAAARDADAAYLKTSTGVAAGGATVEDVAVLAAYLPTKAAGGIGSWDEARAMFEAGAVRIGASSGVDIVTGYDGDWTPPDGWDDGPTADD